MSTPLIIPGIDAADRRHSRVLQAPLAAPRAGIMLHYDDSSRDEWAVAWFHDDACKNGYTWLVLDDGSIVELADPAKRTPHAGPCHTPQASSRFYGIAAATNGLVLATPAQTAAIAQICRAVFTHHGWDLATGGRLIVGHDEQAVWTTATTRAAGMPDSKGERLWGELGRKVDPTGIRADRRPIVDVRAIRRRLSAAA